MAADVWRPRLQHAPGLVLMGAGLPRWRHVTLAPRWRRRPHVVSTLLPGWLGQRVCATQHFVTGIAAGAWLAYRAATAPPGCSMTCLRLHLSLCPCRAAIPTFPSAISLCLCSPSCIHCIHSSLDCESVQRADGEGEEAGAPAGAPLLALPGISTCRRCGRGQFRHLHLPLAIQGGRFALWHAPLLPSASGLRSNT